MVRDLKFCINTDDETYGPPRFYTTILERMGLRDDSNDDIVFNIDSIHNKKLKKGKKCTIYAEADAFLLKGNNYEFYDGADLMYIASPKYLPIYPAKTKLITPAIDPEWHYPRDVEKKYDYIFVGRTDGDHVYTHRKDVLNDLQTKCPNMLVTEGTVPEYCDLLSSSRIILNINPRKGDDVCATGRIFEGMVIGVIMTDECEDMKTLELIPNVHYLPIERFGEKFTDKELDRIHKAGSEFALKNFTYQGAIKQIINDVEEFLK